MGSTGFNIVVAIVHLLILIVAVYLAVQCNKPGERVLPVIGALILPEIYILQRVVRKDILLEPNYGCSNSLRNTPAGFYTKKEEIKNIGNNNAKIVPIKPERIVTEMPEIPKLYEEELYNPPSRSFSRAEYK